MRHLLSLAIVGLLAGMALAQGTVRLLHEIAESYAGANTAFVERLGGKSHTISLLSRLQMKDATRLQRCGYHYAMAILGVDTSRHVRQLTETAKMGWGSGVGEAVEALPEALGRVYMRTANPRALQILLDLRLDGGPAESQLSVVGDLLFRAPRAIGGFFLKRKGSLAKFRSWMRAQGEKDYVVSRLRADLAGDGRLDALRGRLAGQAGQDAVAALALIEFIKDGIC
jgi:hypothetical protein